MASLAADIADALELGGFSEAANNYRQAWSGYRGGAWESANSQLRTAMESLLTEAANARTGRTSSGAPSAIDRLVSGGTLAPEEGAYVKGVWGMSHRNGSHPGRSDEREAQHRMYAVSTAIDFILSRVAE